MMVTQILLPVRKATLEDRQKLANLIHFEINVHRHLDWRPPLDWVGHHPYLLIEQNGRAVAALACPPDPPRVAWIRMFAVSANLSSSLAWASLWPEALANLEQIPGVRWAAAIPLQNWFRELLEEAHFDRTHRVVMLHWEGGKLPPERPRSALTIRPMNYEDIPAVHEIDANAFVPLWQNSRTSLELAFKQSAVATVVEEDGQAVGYQISTGTPLGGHLARLAVCPDRQGQGIGALLLRDLLSQFLRRGAQHITVNTQKENAASLALYEKMGFHRTGEEYPIYQYELNR